MLETDGKVEQSGGVGDFIVCHMVYILFSICREASMSGINSVGRGWPNCALISGLRPL